MLILIKMLFCFSNKVLAFPKLNRAIPSKPIAEQLLEPDLEYISAMHNHVKAFQKVLDEAVRVRVADIPFHRYEQRRMVVYFDKLMMTLQRRS